MDNIEGDIMTHWTDVKPMRKGQLFFRDFFKLDIDTELEIYSNDRHSAIYDNRDYKSTDNTEIIYVQFVKAILERIEGDKDFWSIKVRNADGEYLLLDLGLYGGTRIDGNWNADAWIKLKEIE
jgi:hypothetical protein